MNRILQLVIILCIVTLSTAIISHSIIAWLHIERTGGRQWVVGPVAGRPAIFMAGSSLAEDGLSWARIGDVLNMRIEGWALGGSSPAEWERFQHLEMHAKRTVLVVSPYDLNEYILCDLRAEIVPFKQTIKDLWQSRADWPFSKRLISLYPLTYLRELFPTAGRSDGVMVGVREKLKGLVRPLFVMKSEAGPTLSLGESVSDTKAIKENIDMWDSGRMLRRLASIRDGCQGRHSYSGPKNMAFQRMLLHAKEKGRVDVVVLPVSPAYAKEFLTPEVKREFEEALTEAQHSAPKAHWIRLDQLKELNSNEFFWDLVHMNSYGQMIATEAFLSRLMELKDLP